MPTWINQSKSATAVSNQEKSAMEFAQINAVFMDGNNTIFMDGNNMDYRSFSQYLWSGITKS